MGFSVMHKRMIHYLTHIETPTGLNKTAPMQNDETLLRFESMVRLLVTHFQINTQPSYHSTNLHEPTMLIERLLITMSLK